MHLLGMRGINDIEDMPITLDLYVSALALLALLCVVLARNHNRYTKNAII